MSSDKPRRARSMDRNLYLDATRWLAISYLTSSLLLLGFHFAGTISLYVPLAYAIAGGSECALLYYLDARDSRDSDPGLGALQRLIISTSIQLLFIAIAPQIGFYFLSTLFVIYSLGTMGMSGRQSFIAWGIGTIITGLLLLGRHGSWVPQSNASERALVWLSLVTMLGRCVLLGVLGRSMRITLQKYSYQLSESVGALKQRDQSLERVNAELQHQATHDALTELANRVLFADRLEEALRRQAPFAVCVLDLDRFKVVNDSLGHSAGDELLKLVGRRLLSTTRADDVVARAGGDEFLLLLRDVSSREEVERLVARWMEGLAAPYRIQGTELQVSPSIGIARYPSDGNDAEDLLARADDAMYQAKQSGRNMFRFFDAALMRVSRERLAIEADLRRAITNCEFQLYYQPKIDIATGEIRSVEALLRWQHPSRGTVMPAEFIAIAEDTGLISPIGEWVIREACRQARAWETQGFSYLRVAVNVSSMQFRQSNFADIVRDALSSNSLDPSYLEIELTEAALMHNADRSIAMLEQLSRLGVVVAIDDFGIGYSSLTHLRRFPIDKLKIDLSLIRHLETNQDDASIVRAIISMTHALRLKVVAEGVDSIGQLDILKALGCDQYQGFLRSPAVPASDIKALLVRPEGSAGQTSVDRTFSKLTRLFRAKP
jgi:diguanylate cyclase (GGDEF)-like protein